MADYDVQFVRSARKDLERLPIAVVRRILAAIARLSADPRPIGVRKLEGASDLWRVRVGDYRVIYAIDDKTQIVDIRVVRHRKEAYRR